MITELERQFIDSAAHDIWTLLYSAHQRLPVQEVYLIAAIFLGRVLEANGATLEIITYAAWQADYGERDPQTSGEIKAFASKLYAAITTEALWRGRGETSGPTWTDGHAAVKLPATDDERKERCNHSVSAQCVCSPNHDPELVIPPLRLAGGA